MSRSFVVLVSAFLLCGPFATAVRAQSAGESTVAQIDTECDAVLSAVSQTMPVSVILQGRRWIVLDPTQLAAAVGSGTPHYAGVYKQGARYVYVREVSFNDSGQHALGLCYRSDGTLERARQAKTVPGLSSEEAARAYYASDGSLIQKTPNFNEKDPTIAKNLKDLRYFSVLPPP